MTPVVRLLEAGLLAWFGAFALLVIIRVLRDGMATGGMLVSNPDKDGVDPERVVAMAIVPAVLAFYTIHAMNTARSPTGSNGTEQASRSSIRNALGQRPADRSDGRA